MSNRKEKRKLLIFNIHFWIMLSITFDTGFCAIRSNRKPISDVYREKAKNFDTPFVLRNPPLYERMSDYEMQKKCENESNAFFENMGFGFAMKGHFFPVNNNKEFDDSFSLFDKEWKKKSTFQKTGFYIYNICEDIIDNVHIFSGSKDYVREKYRVARGSPANTNPTPANDESPFLKHTTIISHIVNGIFLQTGLMNGKIPVDELAGEILNFGSVKVSDIANFEPKKITDLTGRLKEASKTLNANSSPEIQKLEEEAIKWNQLHLDYESVGDNLNAKNDGSYLKDVATLKGMLTDLDGIGSELATCLAQIDILENNLKILNEKLIRGSLDYLAEFGTYLKTRSDKLKAAVEKLNGLNSLKDGLTIFKPLATMVHIMNTRDEKFQTSPENVESIKKSIEHVAQLVESFKSSSQDIKNINELVRRKSNPQARTSKYIHGFTNGISDLEQLGKDSRDPWIAKITHFDVSKLNGLSDGLMPLMKFIDPLSKADNDLDPILSDTIPQSFMELDKVQDTATMMPSDSISSVTILNDLSGCQHFRPQSANIKTSTNFIENVKVLTQLSTTFSNAVGKLNLADLEKPISDFIKSIGFSMNMKDLTPVFQKLKAISDFKNLRTSITETKNSFSDGNTLEKTVIPAIETGDGTKENEFIAALKIEKEHAKCLQGHSEKSEKFVKAVEVVRTLRGFDVKKYENVEVASSSIAKVSKDLAPLKSIVDTMKKLATERAKLINKLKDSDKKSQSIGQSVSSLHYAYGLKGLGNSIAQLKLVGPIVETEINKIKSPTERKDVEDQWGNHQIHISELEASLTKIKSFEATVDISKASTIAHYGAPLKNLETVSDAKINAQDKIKALDALIENADPANKGALEEAKKTLRTISSLDLDFSSHKSQFQSAPAEFKAFDDFLVDFLTTASELDSPQGFPWKTVGVIVGSIIIVLVLSGGGYFLYIRHKKKKQEEANRKKELEEAEKTKQGCLDWIEMQNTVDEQKAAEVHKNEMTTVFLVEKIDFVASHLILPREKHRYAFGVPCIPKNIVSFKVPEKGKIVLHANMITTCRTGRRFIGTQGPMESTFEDFWFMVLHHHVEYIVMLCDFDEGGFVKCGRYLPTAEIRSRKFGDIKVSFERATTENQTITTVLQVDDSKKRFGEKRTVKHIQYKGWKDREIPTGHEETWKIMETVKTSPHPVVVHCSAGIGRTMSFIGTEFLVEEVERNSKIGMTQAMIHLRDCRAMGVQNTLQMDWVQKGITYSLCKKYDLDKELYNKQYAFHCRIKERLNRIDLELKGRLDQEKAAAVRTVLQQNRANGQQNGGRADAGGDEQVDEEVPRHRACLYHYLFVLDAANKEYFEINGPAILAELQIAEERNELAVVHLEDEQN